ncbi:MAG: aldehyde ferredoxin oxidoreductase N-terminal domain-containing protein, partial [Candidatus Freyarchaeota archaeon]
MEVNVDPLGPENLLFFASGPLTGLLVPSAGKLSIVSISPATGIYADSNVGGAFGVELKQAVVVHENFYRFSPFLPVLNFLFHSFFRERRATIPPFLRS